MKALVSASARFQLAPDGSLWTPNESLAYRFWSRYLDVYDEITLCVRTTPCQQPGQDWNKASGPGIVAAPLPDFHGPRELLSKYRLYQRAIRTAIREAEAIHLRIPCPVGSQVWQALPHQRPYGVEVVGDPRDALAHGAYRHALRALFRIWFTRTLRAQCARAAGALYVTEYTLQRRYPCANFTTHSSSIDLEPEAIIQEPRILPTRGDRHELIFVGSLEQLYKGPDTLLDALALCIQEDIPIGLTFVGDGQYRRELEDRANALGITEHVRFTGYVKRKTEVYTYLDQADLFVLPSRQEGLPRAMIEAMARALPCIGTAVGGIPELLPDEDMAPVNHPVALKAKIREVLADSSRMQRMSERNLRTAHKYTRDILRARRSEFYRHICNQTTPWLEQNRGHDEYCTN